MSTEKILSLITAIIALAGLVALFVFVEPKFLLYATVAYALISIIQFAMKILAIQSFVVDALIFGLGMVIGNFFKSPNWIFGAVLLLGFELMVNSMNAFLDRA